MELTPSFKILWEGKFPLDCIKWNKKEFKEFQLSSRYVSEIKENWDNHIIENPNDYDGNLLFLDNFYFDNNRLYLNASFIKFSTVIYMVKNKIQVKKGIGMLGTQYLISSPNKKYILAGERSLSQSYFPGALTVPGGMLEFNDLNNSPKEALTREMYEEVRVPLRTEVYLVAILGGWNGVSVTFLISTQISDSHNFNPNEIIHAERDEWKNNLWWLSTIKLKSTPINLLLDGLIYYRTKLVDSEFK